MGYTHHWIRPKAIDQATYRKIQRDMLVALELLPGEYPGPEYAGLPIVIVGWDGLARPTVDRDNFFFNGDPLNELEHEPFDFPRLALNGHLDMREMQIIFQADENDCFQFCKTNRKPYDLAVCACLLVARCHLGDRMKLMSDGIVEEEVWQYAFDMAHRAVGPGGDLP